ncbi:hypothetical protein [Xanthomonas translucens]|uniref:Uncharacterized protein n=1 Tax=Xanthomonas translucens pv. translucens TaxID=134875 RepID=A0ABW9KYH7_XANCT|nr:hypothetical protein [Xanthomonas translucens]MCC8447150.1 hypothetical protein [Xanthomonas translucens pv. translucens]MCT8287722.1 hypothetical protein [Xanthomonas translucens pv. translucens]MCT8305380.1 hypothetical protein [Xanthomonas translucens pv. translucens]QSQ31788.1 hypothetical protein ISN30_08375 [Xanthomonas translucens pv. translucens]QSQ32389.1 hypothetical protein ISN31_10560 [Xanthomonas translucens pv. translucens]
MKYSNGEVVLLGDKVGIGGGGVGIVVAVIDTGEYSSGYAADEWSYLSAGALVESPQGGLIHYLDAEHDFELLERAEN